MSRAKKLFAAVSSLALAATTAAAIQSGSAMAAEGAAWSVGEAAPGSVPTPSPSSANERTVLPPPPAAFQGTVGLNAATSTPDWPKPVEAPRGAPNVLLIMTDDIGFGVTSTFGGPVPTPNFDQLAQEGIRYDNFHTTAMCSATRAALLTGRNHHAVGSGAITDMATGFPGYSSVIPKSAATIAEVLKDNGFSTAMFGKHHNIPRWEASLAGPFDHWPTGLGFEYFMGFIIGDTNQWNPRLFRNTVSIDNPPSAETTLDHTLADDAIHWIHQEKAAAPDKPFFVYYAPGTGHAPHQAPPEWIAKFKGRFDQGWDAVREETFKRQKALGVIPANAALTPRPPQLPAWTSLSSDQRRLYARYMEVFAGMIAYQDDQIGRVLGELRRMRQLDNTLVIFIDGDNGASGEGGLDGTQNEVGRFNNGLSRDPQAEVRHIDDMGGPHSYELYPAAWAWSMDTPFQWMKQIASHLGGIRNGLVIRWPGHTQQSTVVRGQFAHVTDIMPTIFEAVGVTAPTIVDGVRQQPIDGRSLEYTFENASAPEPPRTQYFEMLGNRAVYKDGWMANTIPVRTPWQFGDTTGDVFGGYQWQLYDLRSDYSQSHDIALEHPEKLKEMQAVFLEEAKRNQVLPLDDRLNAQRSTSARRHFERPRSHYEYWGKDISIAEDVAPSFAARNFDVTADVVVANPHETGPILARGSWFGGWSFYLKDGRPAVAVARSEYPEDQFRILGDRKLAAGASQVGFSFRYDGGGLMKGGQVCILINGVQSGCGRVERTPNTDAGQGETLDIGKDTGAPVTSDYPDAARFAGEINKVSIDLQPPAALQTEQARTSAEAKAD